MKILVTGTPGVGKTTFCSRISQELGIMHVEMSRYIEENGLYTELDQKFNSLLFDADVVADSLSAYLRNKDSYVVDSHDCGALSGLEFDLIFILTVPIETLHRRLSDRGYDDVKIKENIQCEIFGIVREDVEDIFGDNFHVVGGGCDELTLDNAFEMVECKVHATQSAQDPR